MHKLFTNILSLLIGAERIDMMAKLWATEILSAGSIEDAKKLWGRVPRLLKTKVQTILEAADADLAAEIIGE